MGQIDTQIDTLFGVEFKRRDTDNIFRNYFYDMDYSQHIFNKLVKEEINDYKNRLISYLIDGYTREAVFELTILRDKISDELKNYLHRDTKQYLTFMFLEVVRIIRRLDSGDIIESIEMLNEFEESLHE